MRLISKNTKLNPLLHFKFLFLILNSFYFKLYTCTSIITSTQFIKDSQTLFSDDKTFKLEFFSPVNTSNRYAAIFYNKPVKSPVWVANREKPLLDSFGTLTISEDGNLVVLDGNNMIVWSSNVSSPMKNSSAHLSNNGNLVLKDDSNGRTLWESFQHPSDVIVQNMKLSSSGNSDQRIVLKSWRSPSDPSVGRFSASLEPVDIPQIFVWDGSNPYWRSGPWNGQSFLGIPQMSSVYSRGAKIGQDDSTIYYTFTDANSSELISGEINSQGIAMEKHWSDIKKDWVVVWSSHKNDCDVYGKCGKFGICNIQNSPICSCLKGFEQKNMAEWSKGNWSSGCVRKTQLQCERNSTINGVDGNKKDGFLKLSTVKLPDFAKWSGDPVNNCEQQCLSNCSCVAYAINSGIGCMHWNRDLIDLMKFSGVRGTDLYLRVAYLELEKSRGIKTVIIVTVLIGFITILGICSYFLWRLMAKRAGEGIAEEKMNKVKLEEIPLFSYEKLAIATENFKSENKLGQGGFGPVYKGKLPGGQLIAVKRLSRSSGQGLEEFMNEVLVISKLQHRNLVRLLGCCIEGKENMLIYEYMSNRSLDSHLFDNHNQEQLDWGKRVKIIEGIGRGLLYLHRDSRLRIIHRDLKASNILLDEELNSKISDFGMARIFRGDQDQANTMRVVGTYGYMAPEYAMDGRFSEKSDIYSFGILVLEIVSGRRNTSFYQDANDLSLLGYAWKLWNEENIANLVDSRLSDQCNEQEIERYIHVALLCVEEFAKYRPSVSTVLSMLSREISDLPAPKQPAFTHERRKFSDKYGQAQENCSRNDFTATVVQAR